MNGFLVILLCSVLFFLADTSAFAAGKSNNSNTNDKYAAVVMDADTGAILHQRYADKTVYPASLTKIMTLVMVFDALEKGNLDLNSRVRVSSRAASMVPSKLGLQVGSSIRVKDAIYALVTKSANDVAVALAEHLGGTESEFARQMTTKAQELGMNKTTFRNASGLHDARQVTTARDMAKLARAVIVNYPSHYRYFSTRSFTYSGNTYGNHNKLLGTYNGMDGIKTGYINASGFNLVASAVRNNHRIIGVVFGGRTSKSRNDHMVQLLDEGFAKIRRDGDSIRYAEKIDGGGNTVFASAGGAIPLPPPKPFFQFSDSQVGVTNAATTAGAPIAQTAQTAQNVNVGNIPPTPQNWAALNNAIDRGEYTEEIIGQGDAESTISRQPANTGLTAVAAKRYQPNEYETAAYSPQPSNGNTQNAPSNHYTAGSSAMMNSEEPWAIQVGAFSSRAKTDEILHQTIRDLSSKFANLTPVIAPLRTPNGWIFRARIHGFDKNGAQQACSYIKGCMAVAPRVN